MACTTFNHISKRFLLLRNGLGQGQNLPFFIYIMRDIKSNALNGQDLAT